MKLSRQMATKHYENWYTRLNELKAHVAETGHFPNKHTQLNNWVRYQRKRRKAGTMPEDQLNLFNEIASARSKDHTGGRKKLL